MPESIVNEYDPSSYGHVKQDASTKAATWFVQDDKKKFNARETAERYKYLLEVTDIFSRFLKSKAEKDPKQAEVLKLVEQDKVTAKKQRLSEKEEDAEMMKAVREEHEDQIEFTESPPYIDGQLRQYQVQGLNWLVSLDTNHLSGILADEMGLGKTLQTISFLGYLRYLKKIEGPHLVIVPKSTLDNWKREFAHWTPEVSTVVLTGNQEERNALIKDRIISCDFDVVISSYEIVIREKSTLRKFDWQYIIVDEAHRLKNEDSLLSQIIRGFHSKSRLLLTGTPLQNNLHELWALLNFLLPDIFSDSDTFDEWFQENHGDDVVKQLHKVLQPFLLRRIKADVERSLLPKKELNVYVGMTHMQKQWYQKILERDIDAVNGSNKKESKTRLMNIAMQLRKCCNHPYLFDGAEPGPPYTTDEHLVYNCEKMLVLDKMLKRFESQGSRVLIFSQMSRMLDILEDYAVFRGWGYCRIDGQTDHADRIRSIDAYNEPGSDKFLFLLTTRAGGLGINLTSADIVVLYDSDWNPQADLQAMDRAHRIGQKKQVKVFRFVTENAIEEKIIERASQKLRLDQLVIQQGRQLAPQEKKKGGSEELLNMIQHGAETILKSDASDSKTSLDDTDIDQILAASEEKTSSLKSKFSSLGIDDLQNFTSDENVYEWDGKNFQKKKPKELGLQSYQWIEPSARRERKSYSVDQYYREVLSNRSKAPVQHSVHQPKHLNLYDHQFFPTRLWELHDLEMNNYRRKIKQNAEAKGEGIERELNQQLDQAEIDRSRPLTEEEEAEKQELLEQGFGNWSRKDFYQFVSACAKYGRNHIADIAMEFPEKTEEEVKEYAEAFWEHYAEIDGYERQLMHIEQGEDRIRKLAVQNEMLRRKMAQYKSPLQQMNLKNPPHSSKRTFTDDEDRFLLVQMFRIGLDNPEVYEIMRETIQTSPLFDFDFWFQSRTSTELNRRCLTLLTSLQREFERQLPSWYKPREKRRRYV